MIQTKGMEQKAFKFMVREIEYSHTIWTYFLMISRYD